MAIIDTLKAISIEEPVIEGLRSAYFARIARNADAEATAALNDRRVSMHAWQAAADAIVVSTLAAIIEDDERFVEIIDGLNCFDDTFFEDMRFTLVRAGIRNAKRTLAKAVISTGSNSAPNRLSRPATNEADIKAEMARLDRREGMFCDWVTSRHDKFSSP